MPIGLGGVIELRGGEIVTTDQRLDLAGLGFDHRQRSLNLGFGFEIDLERLFGLVHCGDAELRQVATFEKF